MSDNRKNEETLRYICTMIGNLSGVPIRIYKNRSLIFSHSVVWLPVDPICLCEDEILDIRSHIGYYTAQFFYSYGIVNYEDYSIISGPTRLTSARVQELRELAFLAGVPSEETDAFVSGMRAVISLPLESLLQMLLSVNFFLNEEMLEITDLTIREDEQQMYNAQLGREQAEHRYDQDLLDPVAQEVHNTYRTEQTLLDLIEKGDVGALDEWLKDAPAVRPGSIAPDQLRQVKNTLIVTATLASRAAVRGGMDVEDAFSLSDAYIRKCELLQTPDRIINLQYHMVLDFTSQVSNLKLHGNSSALAAAVAEYVRHHLSDPVSTEKIAEKLHFSRTWLSRKFHEETGIPLSDFIRIKKTEEAQRLLRYTDKSLREISVYLGYSSQSHFQTVFKKQLGVTPMQYRRNPPDRS
ncbi:MAG TPA: helix-turn-helix domain-containing protein [Candidatus Mediterraneibacter caccavium]|uniref:Helix-turn-helix domain-containing protein n=1 Tax=Candidatus Mediterraneibacter caccavium TaxID=2838661 RepID=A0A9D1VYE4_9FIRM|nr:helix-turn-helix domain-containing protein [Candidatus Mediterraneibacter caccavium]